MSKQVQNFIDDARRFQRCSDHDLAISSLQLAQQEDHHKEHEIEIQKLFSLSYRKIGNYNMALLHINNAINQNAKRNNDKQAQNEHAICLMNKGIIYEESKRYDNALDCYISAVDTFASIDKGTRGSAGRKCPHTASKPLRIHKVFSAVFSLSASISAPAELLRIGQP